MRKRVKAQVLPQETGEVSPQADSDIERDNARSKVEFTISFNPFPAKVKPKAAKPKLLPTKSRAIKPRD